MAQAFVTYIDGFLSTCFKVNQGFKSIASVVQVHETKHNPLLYDKGIIWYWRVSELIAERLRLSKLNLTTTVTGMCISGFTSGKETSVSFINES